MAYKTGMLEIEKLSPFRFRLEGNWMVGNRGDGADHMQLIYEALEIAAQSNLALTADWDAFKEDFKLMRDEFLALTADWVD